MSTHDTTPPVGNGEDPFEFAGWGSSEKICEVIYFTRGDNLPTLNRAVQYVLANEQTRHLKVIHVFKKEEDIPPDLAEHLNTIDHVYPQLRVDFVAVQGEFGPELIERLSRRLKVPKNYMFIGTPGDSFPHKLSKLGGVRLIL